MSFFDQDFIDFFSELRQNNTDREWFNANKKRYEKSVKEPFKAFTAHMLDKMTAYDERFSALQTKNTIFRIYRDVRFSKNKSPYKTHASAALAPGGRKDMINPGIYYQFSNDELGIFSGVYQPDKEALWRIRFAISKHSDELKEALNSKAFKKYFGEIRGDKNKRLPPEFKEAGEKEPLVFHKQFYYQSFLPAEALLKADLPDQIVKHYEAALPVNQFFQKAILGE